MISCKDYVKKRKDILKSEIAAFNSQPTLVVIQVDDDAASTSYINGKKRDCDYVGIRLIHEHINSNQYSQKDLEKKIIEYDCSVWVHGIIIQLPIPDKYDVKKLQKCVSSEKDVDGFRKDSFFTPCTPKGIIDWLEYNNYQFEGKNATVLGRSEIVGKPMNNILIDKGMTVTCCNSKTDNYTRLHAISNSDLVIVAIGKAKRIKYDHFFNCTTKHIPEVIVDVGINEDENGNLCGDVNNEKFEFNQNVYLTSVPGGVGLLTRLSLVENVVTAYKRIEGV